MQIESLSDEKTKDALRENETRLAAMNLIHNKLYLDHNTTQIEMQEYLGKLLQYVKDSFCSTRKQEINLKIQIDQIWLEADKAVAIGLIVNELATNAFKHAFGNKPGEIHLTLEKIERSKIILKLRDNGKGLIAAPAENDTSFGLKLVKLMARQLDAVMIVDDHNGLSYQFEIKFIR
jgi:two-component sensor histidine kinase